jgi:GNAT superfamily N-acetyltransferase
MHRGTIRHSRVSRNWGHVTLQQDDRRQSVDTCMRPAELRQLRQMQQVASRLWGPGRRWTPGEIGWAFLTGPAEHLVVEAPDRVLAASCIAWLDPTTGTAAIEPLGVRPAYRRRGLAGALCRHAAQVVRAAGGREIVVHPLGDGGYPAPLGAYLRCGFHRVGRTRLYVRS